MLIEYSGEATDGLVTAIGNMRGYTVRLDVRRPGGGLPVEVDVEIEGVVYDEEGDAMFAYFPLTPEGEQLPEGDRDRVRQELPLIDIEGIFVY